MSSTSKRAFEGSDDIEMDVEGAGPSNVAKKTKFTKTDEDATLRQTVYNDILNLTTSLLMLIKVIDANLVPNLGDLSFMNQICAAVLSCVGFYRKIHSTKKKELKDVSESIKIGYRVENEVKFVTVPIKTVIEEWQTKGLLRHGTTTEGIYSYFGSMNSALEFLNLFKLRLNELRLGRAGYFTNSQDKKAKSVMEHHINPKHVSLLSGVTFAPERMSAQLQSLGSLTLFIGMCNQREPQYVNKYKKAFLNSISHIPSAKSITEYLAQRKRKSKPHIVGLLQGILGVVGDRQSHRIAVPFGVFYSYFKGLKDEHVKACKTAGTLAGDIDILCDSSGRGAYTLIRAFQESNFFYFRWGGTSATLGQVIHHAIHDTACGSFSILGATTTNQAWLRRYELIDEFKKSSLAPLVRIEPIKVLRVAKMAQAAKNNILARGSGTITSDESRNGYYIREYNKDDKDLSYAQVGAKEAVNTDETVIEQSLEMTRKHVWAEIERQGGAVKHVTTNWYELNDYIGKRENPLDFCPRQCRENFFNLKPV